MRPIFKLVILLLNIFSIISLVGYNSIFTHAAHEKSIVFDDIEDHSCDECADVEEADCDINIANFNSHNFSSIVFLGLRNNRYHFRGLKLHWVEDFTPPPEA